jgi:hypothetical protein
VYWAAALYKRDFVPQQELDRKFEL